MPELPEAQVVVLRKMKKLAPEFHRHIAASQVRGRVVRQGDQVLIYEVAETIPEGRVLVAESTRFEFV
jgi:hypothetical protein